MDNKFPIEPTTPIETKEPVVLHSGQLDGSLMDLPSVRPVEGDPTLEEAWAEKDPETEEYIMKVPENAAAITPEKKSRKKLFAALGGVTGLLLAGGIALGVNSANNDEPKSEPVAEAPANPGEEVPFGEEPANPTDPEVTPEEAEPETPEGFEVVGLRSLAEIEISAEQTDEEIAQDLVQLSSDWSMSGANREMSDLSVEGDNGYLSLDEYASKVADATDPIFAEALYGSNASNPQFADAIALQEKQHHQVLMAHYQTYGSQSAAPYYQKENFSQLQEAIKHEDGTTTMFVTMIREDNSADNIVEGSGNGEITRATYVTAEVDGKIKLVQPPAYVLQ